MAFSSNSSIFEITSDLYVNAIATFTKNIVANGTAGEVGQVLVSAGDGNTFWGFANVIGGFSVKTYNTSGIVNTFSDINTIIFDEDSNFILSSSNSRVVNVSTTNKFFTNYQVNGANVISAVLNDTLNLIAGDNIAIVGSNTATKSITISAIVANTSTPGVVQLLDSVTNTSITYAATANSAKTAYDAAINGYTNAVAYAASNTYVNNTFAPKIGPIFTGNAIFDTNTLFVDSVNGRVGIRTSTPATTMDIDGSLYVSSIIRNTNGGNNSVVSIQPGPDTDTGFYWPGTNSLGIVTAGVDRIRITPSGNVGINNTAPTHTLSVQGDTYFGNTTINGFANIIGDTSISGNLTVSGTTTYINTTTLNIGDNKFVLNADWPASAPSEDAGFEVNRGTSPNTTFQWNETDDYWESVGGGFRAVNSSSQPILSVTDDGNLSIANSITANTLSVNSISVGSITIGGTAVSNDIQVLDDISFYFDGTRTTFDLSIDRVAFDPIAPEQLLINVGGLTIPPFINSYDYIFTPIVSTFNKGYVINSDGSLTFAFAPTVDMSFDGRLLNTTQTTAANRSYPFAPLSIVTSVY